MKGAAIARRRLLGLFPGLLVLAPAAVGEAGRHERRPPFGAWGPEAAIALQPGRRVPVARISPKTRDRDRRGQADG